MTAVAGPARTAAGSNSSNRPVQLALRALVGLMGLVDIVTGSWALVDPAGWFRSYPGFGHHWVATQGGAFNDHLVSDTGVGFLAIGVVLLAALVQGSLPALRIAALGLLAHSLPHFLFHLLNPAHELHGFDVVAGVWGLLAEAIVALAVLVGAREVRER